MCRNGNINFNESDFLNANYFFIHKYSREINFRLEQNERLSACQEGFLYSVRTYRNHYGKFESYAKKCMNEFMEIRRKELSKQKRCEEYNFSLDKSIFFENEKITYGDAICSDNQDCFEKIELEEFIAKMDSENKQICVLLANGYKNKEIRNILNLSEAELKSHKSKIKQELLKYMKTS